MPRNRVTVSNFWPLDRARKQRVIEWDGKHLGQDIAYGYPSVCLSNRSYSVLTTA